MRFLISQPNSFQDPESWGPLADRLYERPVWQKWAGRIPARLFDWVKEHYTLRHSIRIWTLCLWKRYDAVAIGREGFWFPFLARLLLRRPRLVMFDIEWTPNLRHRLDGLSMSLCDAVCVNTRYEIAAICAHSGIPRDRFHLVLMAFEPGDIFEAADEGYVCAGGMQGRDWGTLFKAVEGLPYPVHVYTRNPVASPPSNVSVRWASRADYYRALGSASCVVVPVLREPWRITGPTSWTNALAMGKVVIATDPHGASDYMENGVSGFYVDHGDAGALRDCLVKVMGDPELRRRVGEAARDRAWREFSPEVFRHRVLAVLAGQVESECRAK